MSTRFTGPALILAAAMLSTLNCAPSKSEQGTRPPDVSEPDDSSSALIPGREMRIDSVIDRVHFAFKPGANGFTAGHSTHTATVDQGILRVTPYHHADEDAVLTGAPIEIETTAIYRGDAIMDIAFRGAEVDLNSGRLLVERAQVVEEFKNHEGGVEQSWRFASAPGSDGDLVVEVAAVGHSYIGTTDGGLHFASPGRLGFRYSHAVWIGADGTDVAIAATYVDNAIRLVVPEDVLSGTIFPAILDPTVGAETAVDTPVLGWTGAGARRAAVAAAGDQFLVAWQDDRGADRDIYGTRISAAGQVLDPLGIAISVDAGVQDNPTVAFAGGSYAVAWQEAGNIRGARVSTAGAPVGLGNIAATAADEVFPRMASRGATALLVYESAQDVRGAIFNGTSFGATFAINATAEGEREPAVAANPGGDYLVTWTEGAAQPNLRGRLVTAGGAPSGAAFDVSAAEGSQSQSSASFDGSNFFVVFANNSSGIDVYGTRVSPGGAVLDTRTEGTATVGGVPISTAASTQNQPEVSCRDTGCLVAWSDRRSLATTGFDIFAQLLNGDFTLAGGEIALAAFGRDQRSPALAASSTGWLSAWHDDRHGGGEAVHVARVTAGGAVSDPDGIMVVTGNNRESGPTVTETAANWLVAWSDSRAFGADILGLRVRFDGTNQDLAARPVAVATGQQGSPDAARVGARTLVTWNDARNGNDDIFAARLESNGALVDPAGIAISTAPRDQIFPEVASDGTSALIVWQDRRDGGFDVYGALLDGNGAVVVPDIALCAAAGDQSRPSVAFDAASGLYLVAWSDRRVDPADIYAARVDASGNVLDPCGVVISGAADAQNNPDVTFGGGRFFVSWEDRRSGNGDIFGARVTTTAGITVLDPDGVAISTAVGNQTEPVGVFAQQSYVVVWADGRNIGLNSTDIFGGQVSTAGTAGPNFAVSETAETEGTPALSASGGSNPNLALVAYSRRVAELGTSRVFHRRLTPGGTDGGTCNNNGQCESGFCVDGRCCDSACGGGVATDCQACSVARGAAQDGVCGPVAAGRVCRNYATVFCDRRERCDGASLECPEDIGRRQGRVCDETCGAVCPADDVSGAPHFCPACP